MCTAQCRKYLKMLKVLQQQESVNFGENTDDCLDCA